MGIGVIIVAVFFALAFSSGARTFSSRRGASDSRWRTRASCHRGHTPFRPVAFGNPSDPCIVRRERLEQERRERERMERERAAHEHYAHQQYAAETARRRTRSRARVLLAATAGVVLLGLIGASFLGVASHRTSVTYLHESESFPGTTFGREEFESGIEHGRFAGSARQNGSSKSHFSVRFDAGPSSSRVAPPRRAEPQSAPPIVATSSRSSEPASSGIHLEDDAPATTDSSRPAWVEAAPNWSGDRYTVTTKTDYFPTPEGCREQLAERVEAEFARYIEQLYGRVPGGVTPPADLVATTVHREYIEAAVSERLAEILERTVVPSGDPQAKPETPGRMYRLHAQLEFSGNTPHVREAYRAALVRSRAEYAALGFGATVALLGLLGGASWFFGGKWPQ